MARLGVDGGKAIATAMARWTRAKWTTARQKTSTTRWGGVGQRQRRGAQQARRRRVWRTDTGSGEVLSASYNEDAEEEVARALMPTEEMKKEGDLAVAVTNTLLLEAFSSKNPSVKVDIATNIGHSMGYKFVSFGDDNERLHTMTKTNGAYCSSRAMLIGAATSRKLEQGMNSIMYETLII
ncbi:hypothetical protein DM860_013023 [Cuscuta australis]|uniref:Uncharacterized protein n=1 Tax=Cuscuta australis TaxID=267555 RepID=A0A328D212_9ASTE|nr:hypothetical protein DM860_013023 [Cuscuta australis]